MQHLLVTDNQYKWVSVGDICILSPQDSKHLLKSLRMSVGDNLTFSNGNNSFVARIINTNDGLATIELEKTEDTNRELPIAIHIFQGMPKGDKLELIIQKCTELGASSITPINMNRSIAVIKADKLDKKLKRYQDIADNAAHQAKRQSSLIVNKPLSFKEGIKASKDFDIVFIAYEDEERYTLASKLEEIKQAKSIAIFIGAEGGFDKSEIKLAMDENIAMISLGKRILRTETAGLAIMSYIMLSLEE